MLPANRMVKRTVSQAEGAVRCAPNSWVWMARPAKIAPMVPAVRPRVTMMRPRVRIS